MKSIKWTDSGERWKGWKACDSLVELRMVSEERIEPGRILDMMPGKGRVFSWETR